MDFEHLLAAARNYAAAGNFRNAALAFEMALAGQPESTVAMCGLGHCLGQLGQRRAAIDLFLRAAPILAKAARKSCDPSPLLALARELQGIQAYRASLPAVDRALKVRPDSAPAHHQRALILDRLNRPEEARQSAARALTLAPRESNAAILLATLELRCGRAETARQLLAGVLALPADPNRARALFEMGRVLDRLDQTQEAFGHFAEAGRLVLSSPALSRFDLEGIYRDLADDQARCTTSWRTAQHVALAAPSPAPVFLIGFYRSGSTLLEQVLAAHPNIRSSGEAELLPLVIEELTRRVPGPGLHWTERLERLGPDGIEMLRAHYWKMAGQEAAYVPGEGCLLDKTTMNTVNIGLILTLFPTARIVFALRDPRDVLLSCFMQSFVPTPLTAQLLDWQRAARFYDALMRHWQVMRANLAAPAVDIRYEDLVADLRGALEPVLRHLGLDWHPEMARFHERARDAEVSTPSFADVAKPLYRSAKGRWLRYAEHFDGIAPLLKAHLEEHGYAAP